MDTYISSQQRHINICCYIHIKIHFCRRNIIISHICLNTFLLKGNKNGISQQILIIPWQETHHIEENETVLWILFVIFVMTGDAVEPWNPKAALIHSHRGHSFSWFDFLKVLAISSWQGLWIVGLWNLY